MRIATFQTRRWREAIQAAGHQPIMLPDLRLAETFHATLEERIALGRRVWRILQDQDVDFILDAYGDGMLFVDDPRDHGLSALLHHTLDIPLVSHWTEALRITLKGMDPAVVHQAFQSPTWFKAIFTRSHLAEMEWMGVPGCFYLPLAEDDLPHPTDPPAVDYAGPKVFFGGSQQSLYFAHADGVDTRTQWPGGLAVAATADGSAASFLDAYRRYDLGPCPADTEDFAERAERVRRYHAHKLFYSAWRNLGLRDRFIIFLRKELGDDFRLVGHERWNKIYGLSAEPPVERSVYFELIRKTPVCLNMPNGDNETGLNLRHFEITAAGGFMLSYYSPELAEMFDIGRECAAFRNETELTEQIDYYLAHPAERDAVARAGQQRTLSKHLLHHRLESVLHWLRIPV